MADNTAPTNEPLQPLPKTTEEIEAIVDRRLTAQLKKLDYMTSKQVTALLEKQTDTFQAGLGSLRAELLGGINSLRGDVFDELKEWRNVIKGQDLAVRHAEEQTKQATMLASEIRGQNTSIENMLNRLSIRLDTVTEDLDDQLEEALRRIEAQIAMYTNGVKAEFDGRITPLETSVKQWQERERRIKQAAKFVLTSPKWLAVIGGGGTAGALLLELLKAIGGG